MLKRRRDIHVELDKLQSKTFFSAKFDVQSEKCKAWLVSMQGT